MTDFSISNREEAEASLIKNNILPTQEYIDAIYEYLTKEEVDTIIIKQAA